MNLEEEIANQLSQQMSDEIDREILWGMLEGSGWKKVSLPRFVDNAHAIDIRIWIEEHKSDEVLQSGAKFLFKEPKDATMFILRWAE